MGSTKDGAALSYEYRLAGPRDGMNGEEKQRLQARFEELMAERRAAYAERASDGKMDESEAAAALMHEVLSQSTGERREMASTRG